MLFRSRLAKELNVPIELYSSQPTYDKWLKVAESNRMLVTTKCVEIEEVDDFFLLHAARRLSSFFLFAMEVFIELFYQNIF